MRFVPIKFKILRYVADQGVVTVWDVMDYFGLWTDPNTVRIALFRGGVTQQRYGGIRFGIWFIAEKDLFERLRVYYPDIPRFKVRGEKLLSKVPHSLKINKLRTILEKADKINVVDWWSEEYIRSLPVHKKDGLTTHKVPDAIFWRQRKDGSRQKYFLEYERSLKAPGRYGKIFQFYAKRKDVKDRNVVYICETEQIRDKLVKIENELVKGGKLKATDLYFSFIALEEFNRAYAHDKAEGKARRILTERKRAGM
ncbi:MAG: hypothetical protein KC684_09395 [Candidatus Omnitrophica bacterium]|nr:hypothetical protein [Candidatus Omnitrophota bacterium]